MLKSDNNQNPKKALVLLPLVLLLMGNQKSCQKEPPPAGPRQLKKIVDVEKIESRPINLGQAGQFDFEFVVNQQIYTVLADTNNFAFRMQLPVSGAQYLAGQSEGGERGLQKASSEFLTYNTNSVDAPFVRSWLAKPASQPPRVASQSKDSWCMVNLPQAALRGSVNSFEMLGGGGLKLGFTPSGDHNFSLDVFDIQVESFQLDLSLHALNPLSRGVLGSSNVTSRQTNTKVSFGLNLGVFRLGPSFYYNMPLATVTKKALDKAVADLKADLDQKEWYSRVLADLDNELLIVGGENVDLKAGDELAVYNEVYTWSGEPCSSELKYDGIARDPVATGVVETVAEEVSVLKILNQKDEAIELGAKVRLLRKVEDITPAP